MQRWTQLPWPGAPYRSDFYRALDWHVNGKSAYLRVDTFVNCRDPVEPTAFLDGFFASLRASGSEHLILDLREASGGSDDVAIALGRYPWLCRAWPRLLIRHSLSGTGWQR